MSHAANEERVQGGLRAQCVGGGACVPSLFWGPTTFYGGACMLSGGCAPFVCVASGGGQASLWAAALAAARTAPLAQTRWDAALCSLCVLDWGKRGGGVGGVCGMCGMCGAGRYVDTRRRRHGFHERTAAPLSRKRIHSWLRRVRAAHSDPHPFLNTRRRRVGARSHSACPHTDAPRAPPCVPCAPRMWPLHSTPDGSTAWIGLPALR